jgi:pyrophosphatase PpaX
MRTPVVLFDFDGTVVDSGPIILASMRHATETVLQRSYTEQELMASVGGPGLEAQMEVFGPGRVEELVRVYRAHNEPLHETLEIFLGIEDLLIGLRDEGRTLGLVTAKRRTTVELAFARLPIAHLFETVVAGDDTIKHKPSPEPLLLALERLGASAAEAAYVGDSPYDMQAARAAGLYAVGVTWGRIHAREVLSDADVVVDTAQELYAALA